MSGICGYWALGEPTAAADGLEPMLAMLRRRGPDRSATWSDGPVALGHALLATTPEAVSEPAPLIDPASGCVIAADARLDNRDALIAGIGLPDASIGDSELILRAYLKWGEDAPERLLGDFAFAIWDPRAGQMVCARDHMGVRQLIYHHRPGEVFAFASDAQAVVAHPAVPRRVNPARVADFLDNLEGADLESTWFEEVVQLPPAHRLTVSAGGAVCQRYWTLEAGPELNLGSDDAYAEAFLALFTEAVRCRLRSASPVGAMLSGGIDSNAVAAVAAGLLSAEGREPLRTYSAVSRDDPDCVESRCIGIAAANPGFDATLVDHRDPPPVEPGDTIVDPFDWPMTLHRAVYSAASRDGVKIMLDGAAGDLLLNAANRIGARFRTGQLVAAIAEARGEKRFWGSGWTVTKFAVRGAWAGLAPAWLRRLRRRLIESLEDRALAAGKANVSADFARRSGLRDRRERFRGYYADVDPTGREYRRAALDHPHRARGRERYDRTAAQFGIEPRDPFLDLRLVSFCLSLPASQLQDGGWPKLVLRRAMAGVVPDEIIWRRGKSHLGHRFTRSHDARSDPAETRAALADPAIGDVASQSALERSSGDSAGGMDMNTRFELTLLHRWLLRNGPLG